MKLDLKIYNPTQTDKQEEKLDFYLTIKKDSNGNIDLMAVDENGFDIIDGCLISIRANGKVHFYQGVNTKLGFPLEGNDELQMDDE